MSEYKHILVAIDLGDHSAEIARRAVGLAQSCGATLTVLHVADYIPPFYGDYLIPPADDGEEKVIHAATQQLNELIEHSALTGPQTLVISGRPKVEIARIAERENCDLIIVGVHGHHGIVGLLGSTSTGVLQKASCDVLMVR